MNKMNTEQEKLLSDFYDRVYEAGRAAMRDEYVKFFDACSIEAFNRGDQTSQQIFEWAVEAIKELP